MKIINKKDTILTSVKVPSNIFGDFKIECIKRKFSLQKLVTRSIFLYLHDKEFREKITNFILKNEEEKDSTNNG